MRVGDKTSQYLLYMYAGQCLLLIYMDCLLLIYGLYVYRTVLTTDIWTVVYVCRVVYSFTVYI